jgi:hypothetical protein
MTTIKLSKEMKKLVIELKGTTTEFVKRGYSLQQTILKISKQGEKDGLDKIEIREIITEAVGNVVSSRHLRRLLPLELKFDQFANKSNETGGQMSAYVTAPYQYTKEELEMVDIDEDKIERNCSDCGKTIKLKMLEQYRQYDEHDKYIGNLYLCPDCYKIRDKKDWEYTRIKERKEAEVIHPLIGYSYKIKGEKPDYEKSYEEKEEERKECDKLMKEYQNKTVSNPIDNELELKSLTERGREMDYRKTRNMLRNITGSQKQIVDEPWKEMGISKTQYIKELRRKMKLHDEESKQRQVDWDLEHHASPIHLFIKELDKLHYECDCDAVKMRQGIYCDICRLIKPIYDMTLKTFKEAAELRKT